MTTIAQYMVVAQALLLFNAGTSSAAVQLPGNWQNNRRIDIELSSLELATNFVIAKVIAGTEPPQEIACIVKRLGSRAGEASTSPVPEGSRPTLSPSSPKDRMEAFKARMAEEAVDWTNAVWMPFTNSLPIDLGPGDGRRMVWIAGRWDDGAFKPVGSSGTPVHVDHEPPNIVITNPIEQVTSHPFIQLQGYSDEPLQSIRYDLFNASNRVENVQGFVNDQYLDPLLFRFTTNFFSCYDIDLALGSNWIVLRCEDLAGNTATNTFTYVFGLDQDTNPPVIRLDRPFDQYEAGTDTVTARGQLDDPTAQVTATISGGDSTNIVEGMVESEGYFWIEGIPLGPGTNNLLITATDAAGNTSQTNVVVYKGNETITIDRVPEGQLWNIAVTVTGKITPVHPVWVNGVQADVKTDGTWIATNVPVISPGAGATAVFEATTKPVLQSPAKTPKN